MMNALKQGASGYFIEEVFFGRNIAVFQAYHFIAVLSEGCYCKQLKSKG